MRFSLLICPLKRNTGGKFVGYFLTASVAAVVDAGGFAVLQLARWPITLSASLSFCFAALANYLLTSRFVFLRKPSLKGFAAFFAGALVGFCVNVGVTVILATMFGVWPIFAKLVGVGIAFFANFVINLLIVFREPRPTG